MLFNICEHSWQWSNRFERKRVRSSICKRRARACVWEDYEHCYYYYYYYQQCTSDYTTTHREWNFPGLCKNIDIHEGKKFSRTKHSTSYARIESIYWNCFDPNFHFSIEISKATECFQNTIHTLTYKILQYCLLNVFI